MQLYMFVLLDLTRMKSNQTMEQEPKIEHKSKWI